jgi:hypothetical protein
MRLCRAQIGVGGQRLLFQPVEHGVVVKVPPAFGQRIAGNAALFSRNSPTGGVSGRW